MDSPQLLDSLTIIVNEISQIGKARTGVSSSGRYHALLDMWLQYSGRQQGALLQLSTAQTGEQQLQIIAQQGDSMASDRGPIWLSDITELADYVAKYRVDAPAQLLLLTATPVLPAPFATQGGHVILLKASENIWGLLLLADADKQNNLALASGLCCRMQAITCALLTAMETSSSLVRRMNHQRQIVRNMLGDIAPLTTAKNATVGSDDSGMKTKVMSAQPVTSAEHVASNNAQHNIITPDNGLATPSVIDADALSSLDLKQVTEDYQRQFIKQILAKYEGNSSATARAIGVDRSNLHRLMKRLAILDV